MLSVSIPAPRTEPSFQLWTIYLDGSIAYIARSRAEAEGYYAGHMDRLAGYALLGPRVESLNPYVSQYRKGYVAGSRGIGVC